MKNSDKKLQKFINTCINDEGLVAVRQSCSSLSGSGHRVHYIAPTVLAFYELENNIAHFNQNAFTLTILDKDEFKKAEYSEAMGEK